MRSGDPTKLLALLAVVGCTAEGPAPRTNTPAATVVSVTSASSSLPPPRPMAPSAKPPGSRTTIRCGSTACDVGAQICCRLLDGEACVERVEAGADADWLIEQLRACGHPETPVLEVRACDDSSDCRTGQVCCGGQRKLTACSPMFGSDSHTGCPCAEVCRHDGDCRWPGTVCRAGSCQLPDPKVRCLTSTCTPQAPVCCVRQSAAPACSRSEDCGSIEARSIACSGPGGCPQGQRCCYGGGMAFCTALCNQQFAGEVVCEQAADCPQIIGVPFKGCRPIADDPPKRWLRTCRYEHPPPP